MYKENYLHQRQLNEDQREYWTNTCASLRDEKKVFKRNVRELKNEHRAEIQMKDAGILELENKVAMLGARINRGKRTTLKLNEYVFAVLTTYPTLN